MLKTNWTIVLVIVIALLFILAIILFFNQRIEMIEMQQLVN
ncbi:MAG TPA: hypothetical protein VFW07_10825 [Parafilimonas sp.]|nr:hypothetical protein [Parafilimonas sp.]